MGINPDTAFSRCLLKSTHAEVRATFPQIKNVVKAAGATRTMRDQWFVQIDVEGFAQFNWDCRAGNAADARHKAWHAFIRKHGPNAEAA